jgi:allantoinase
VFDLLIKGGKIVKTDTIFEGSIAVKDGKIAAIANSEAELEAKNVIDASGKMIFPGALDTHAHLNDPGYEWREDFFHGSEAAAAGGVTTIIDMPLQNTPALTNKDIFKKKHNAIKEKALVDYAFWGGLVDSNIENISELYDAGIVGLKAFLGPVSPDYSTINMGLAREAMEITEPLNIPIGFHCEEYSIIKNCEAKAKKKNKFSRKDYLDSRPVSAEVMSVKDVIGIAKETGAKVHICHVSHPMAAECIKKAKSDGVRITAETCSHYLVFTEEDLIRRGSIFKCAPPLRTNEDKDELWKYVIDGTLSCVASDHSPCAPEEKSEELHDIWGAWGGISGIQTTFQVMFNEVVHKRNLNPTLLARVLCEGPAKAFNLYPKKGTLDIGADADIVIIDPNKEWEITSESLLYKNKISAFVGLKGKGLPVKTILRGETVYCSGIVASKHGIGTLIKALR